MNLGLTSCLICLKATFQVRFWITRNLNTLNNFKIAYPQFFSWHLSCILRQDVSQKYLASLDLLKRRADFEERQGSVHEIWVKHNEDNIVQVGDNLSEGALSFALHIFWIIIHRGLPYKKKIDRQHLWAKSLFCCYCRHCVFL